MHHVMVRGIEKRTMLNVKGTDGRS